MPELSGLEQRLKATLQAIEAGRSPLGAPGLTADDLADLDDDDVAVLREAGWDCRAAVREAVARAWGKRGAAPEPVHVMDSRLDRWG
jgi:hypothetical protein